MTPTEARDAAERADMRREHTLANLLRRWAGAREHMDRIEARGSELLARNGRQVLAGIREKILALNPEAFG